MDGKHPTKAMAYIHELYVYPMLHQIGSGGGVVIQSFFYDVYYVFFFTQWNFSQSMYQLGNGHLIWA